MPKQTIKMSLSSKSIQDGIKQLREYRSDLKRKMQIFIDRLSKIGLEVVQSTMESVPDDEKGSYYTEVVDDSQGNAIGAKIRLTGDKVLFIEFSAGIAYGTPKGGYPLPSGKEYGIGTYPGQTHAESPYGWWYVDESGQKHHSYGNRSYMPMYKSEQAIVFAIREVAKEVFG